MDIADIVADLRREREQVQEAIRSLERLEIGGRRHGRPPAWLAEVVAERSGRLPGIRHGPRSPRNDCHGSGFMAAETR